MLLGCRFCFYWFKEQIKFITAIAKGESASNTHGHTVGISAEFSDRGAEGDQAGSNEGLFESNH